MKLQTLSFLASITGLAAADFVIYQHQDSFTTKRGFTLHTDSVAFYNKEASCSAPHLESSLIDDSEYGYDACAGCALMSNDIYDPTKIELLEWNNEMGHLAISSSDDYVMYDVATNERVGYCQPSEQDNFSCARGSMGDNTRGTKLFHCFTDLEIKE